MEQIQDNRHCSSDEFTPKKFRVLRQGDFCNNVNSAVQSRSTDDPLNFKSIRFLNIGIRCRSSVTYIRAYASDKAMYHN
jgi:hypothetical protein